MLHVEMPILPKKIPNSEITNSLAWRCSLRRSQSKWAQIYSTLLHTNIQYIFFSLSKYFFTFHKCYVDGGISDNLPQHFKEGETITVSPFCGEHDICPKDVSSNEAHIELRNTSMQLTSDNLERLTYALFPPDEIALSNICRQGYRDTLRFLKEHCKFFFSLLAEFCTVCLSLD